MKILLINNFHYHRGGAERAYFDTKKILEKNGHEVAHFSTKHPQTIATKWDKYFVSYHELSNNASHNLINKIKITFRIWYNFETRRKLKELLADFKPDVAHLHNIFHHLSPSVIDELKKQGIPMVMTLHDFQFVCPNNILFANGKIWEESKKGKFYRCVSDRCVHGSYAKSFVCMIEKYLHKLLGVFNKVDALTAPSNFLSEKSREFDFKKKIIKLPNPIFIDGIDGIEKDEFQNGNSRKYILYLGRLSEEKGVDVLLRAFALLQRPEKLYLMGDGPLKKELISLAKELGIDRKVVFYDYNESKHAALLKKAEMVISPSRCYENAPYGVLDAMSLKKLIICANLGGSKEIVDNNVNGMLFEAGDHEDLAKKIEFALIHTSEREQMAESGYRYIKENYNQHIFYNQLKKIYEHVLLSYKERIQEV